MSIVFGTGYDVSKLKDLDIIEFRCRETVYKDGKITLDWWEAVIKELDTS
jgi:hypothetical protein